MLLSISIVQKKIYKFDSNIQIDGAAVPETALVKGLGASRINMLTSFDGQAITYDQIGNPLSLNGATLSCIQGRKLAS